MPAKALDDVGYRLELHSAQAEPSLTEARARIPGGQAWISIHCHALHRLRQTAAKLPPAAHSCAHTPHNRADAPGTGLSRPNSTSYSNKVCTNSKFGVHRIFLHRLVMTVHWLSFRCGSITLLRWSCTHQRESQTSRNNTTAWLARPGRAHPGLENKVPNYSGTLLAVVWRIGRR